MENLSEDVEKLMRLLDRMVDDPELNREFLENPRAVMEREGISDYVISIILTGDLHQIRDLLDRAGYHEPVRLIIRG